MSVEIDGYIIDVAVRESHQFKSEVTKHPVETGSDVTDHIRNNPVVVILDGVVSDTPFGVIASQRSAGSLPSDEAYARLLEIRDKREPVTITTSIAVYENMALQSLTVPRDARTGDALRFSATFQQVELVTNERTTIRVEPPRAKKIVNRGSKPSKEASPEQVPEKASENSSILYDLILGD